MRIIYKAWHIYRNQNKTGIRFLRDAVEWFNNRHEKNNSDKAPVRLLMDFSEFVIAMDAELKTSREPIHE
jgi:hypothetical protein